MTYQLRGLTFDQFEEGQVFETMSRTITETDVVNFAGISGDYNPLHTDEEFMKGSPTSSASSRGRRLRCCR
jgi:acyl dehydratase